MRDLQELMERTFQDATTLILGQMVDRKLAEQSVRLGQRDRDRLLAHILNGAQGQLGLARFRRRLAYAA
jgi:hypothetical protein